MSDSTPQPATPTKQSPQISTALPVSHPNKPPSKDTECRPPWGTFAAFLSASILLVMCFGYATGSWQLIWMELLVGAAALIVGCLIGFLFGIPRTLVTETATAKDSKPNGAIPYRPNTNLDTVSDWLTKIIVGVGLVQVGQLQEALAATGRRIAESFGIAPPGTSAVTQIVLIAFLVLGFLAGFLWTRIDYGLIQVSADKGVMQTLEGKVEYIANKLENLAGKTENVEKATTLMVTGRLPQESSTADRSPVASLPTTTTADWPTELSEKVEKFKQLPSDPKVDEAKTIFSGTPREMNGRRLEVELEAEIGNALVFTLRVRPTDGKPLTDEVVFLLHPTFVRRFRNVQPQENVAATSISAYGCFTVVAITDHGNTVLAYNLIDVPGIPDWFKKR